MKILLLIYSCILGAADKDIDKSSSVVDEVRTLQSTTRPGIFCIPISNKRKLCGESAVNFCRDNMTALACREFYIRQGLEEVDLNPRN